MGYSEENRPINVPSQDSQQQTPPPAQEPQAYYGFPVPNHPPPPYNAQGYQQPYPYQGVPYEPAYGAPVPGYVVVPAQQLYQPVYQRVYDRVGSGVSTFVGAVLGFFFPIFSLFLLCFGFKLRLKHGVAIGYTLYFILGMIGFIVVASLYTQAQPTICHDMGSCLADVTNGTAPEYWAVYLKPCNHTAHNHNGDNSIDLTHGQCPLPTSEDEYSTVGAQSFNCATCVCDRKSAACDSTKFTALFSWIGAPVYFILALIARQVAMHYRKRIDQEMLTTPYTL